MNENDTTQQLFSIYKRTKQNNREKTKDLTPSLIGRTSPPENP